MAPWFWATDVADHGLSIDSPTDGSTVGRFFQVRGTAFVHMQKVASDGSSRNIFSVTDGLDITVRVDRKDYKPQSVVDGDRLRWWLDVEYTGHEPFIIIANLAARVDVTLEFPQTGVVTVTSSRLLEASDSVPLDADSHGPELTIRRWTIDRVSGLLVHVDVTAIDKSSFESVMWVIDGSRPDSSQLNVNIAFPLTLNIVLPDRDFEHWVSILVRDVLGNETSRSILIPAKEKPLFVITKPLRNPHMILWKEKEIKVAIEGIVFDAESDVTSVMWCLDDDMEMQAELELAVHDPGQGRWHLEATIARPGEYTITVWATFSNGNKAMQELTVKVQELA